jgi:hypothetical protein
VRQRVAGLLAGQLEVAERGLGRVKLRRHGQGQLELALGVAEIAGLQELPSALLAGDGGGAGSFHRGSA